MSQVEVDEAMKAARAALPAWRDLAPVERAAYLHKTADILERDKEKIGTILAKEVAKGIKAASLARIVPIFSLSRSKMSAVLCK